MQVKSESTITKPVYKGYGRDLRIVQRRSVILADERIQVDVSKLVQPLLVHVGHSPCPNDEDWDRSDANATAA